MRKRLTAIMFAGLLVFGVAACDDDGADTGTDLDAPAAPAGDPALDDPALGDPALEDPAMDDPAMEPTEP